MSSTVQQCLGDVPQNPSGAIRHYSKQPRSQGRAEGVAMAVAQYIIENEPDTAQVIADEVGGWAVPGKVRGLAISHHFLTVVGWTIPHGDYGPRPVIGVTDTAREAAREDWPLDMLDWDRDTSIDSWE